MASKTQINLPKSVKRIAATIIDANQRRIYVDSMLNAEISYMAAKNRKFVDPATSQKNRETPKD